METVKADVAVIGGGPGGYVAAIRAATLGLSVAVVERDRLGGVCLNRGCIPTKALICTARALETTRRASRLGLEGLGDARVDQPGSVKRARQVAQRMSKGVGHLMKSHGIRVVDGSGRLVGDGRVEVGLECTVQARHVILAAGARPRPLPGVSFDGERVISSTEALALDRVPERLVVVGAGAIGIEFAYYYAVAGSSVTVVEALDSILPFADPEAVQAVSRAMRRRRVEMRVCAAVEQVRPSASGARVSVRCADEVQSLEADHVLVAIGVQPNTEGLWDPDLGIEMDGPFVRVDEGCATSAERVYAIGDLIGPPLLAHAASHEGIVAAERIAGMGTSRKDGALIPGVVYCQPQVAHVGLSERDALRSGQGVVVGRYPFVASGMAQAAGEPEGFVKLVFHERTGRLAGGVVVGAEASELVSELCLALEAGLTHRDILCTVHPHPTMGEAVMEAAAQAAGEAIHAP